MMRRRKGARPGDPPEHRLHPRASGHSTAQTPDEATAAALARQAQRDLRAQLSARGFSDDIVTVGLALNLRGFTLLVFSDDPALTIDDTFDGFPVEKRQMPVPR